MPTPTEICKVAVIEAERKLKPLIEELQAKVREMEPKVCAYEEQQKRIAVLEQQVAMLLSLKSPSTVTVNLQQSPPTTKKPTIGACFRCGRRGHYIESCFAHTDVEGNELDDD